MSEQVPPSSWPEVWTRPHLSKGRTLLWEDQDMPHMGTSMKGAIIRWVPPPGLLSFLIRKNGNDKLSHKAVKSTSSQLWVYGGSPLARGQLIGFQHLLDLSCWHRGGNRRH